MALGSPVWPMENLLNSLSLASESKPVMARRVTVKAGYSVPFPKEPATLQMCDLGPDKYEQFTPTPMPRQTQICEQQQKYGYYTPLLGGPCRHSLPRPGTMGRGEWTIPGRVQQA